MNRVAKTGPNMVYYRQEESMWKVLKGMLGGEETGQGIEGARIAFEEGRIEDGMTSLHEFLSTCEGGDLVRWAVEAAQLCLTVERLDEAAVMLTPVIDLKLGDEAKPQVHAKLLLSGIKTQQGEPNEALQLARDAHQQATFIEGMQSALGARAQAIMARHLLATDPDKALSEAQHAVDVLKQSEHLPQALAVLGIARAICAPTDPPFEDIALLEEAQFSAMPGAIIELKGAAEPGAVVHAMSNLREQMIVRNEHDPALWRLVPIIADLAFEAEKPMIAVEAWSWLTATHDQRGREKPALDAMLEWAAALVEAGRIDEAAQLYEETLTRSQGLGAEAASKTNREVGLFLAGLGDVPEAKRHLQVAVTRGPDGVVKGEAQVAFGILLMELGETDEGRGLLRMGIAQLPKDHPDLEYAQEQLG